MARGELAAAVVGDDAPVGDREQRVVGVVIARLAEERLVGGGDRQAVAVGHAQQLGLDPTLVVEAVALELDVEPALAEGGAQGGEPRLLRHRARRGALR
ncbi:hypothetical protein FV225_24990, partial [Methylobacterium sp. WL93]